MMFLLRPGLGHADDKSRERGVRVLETALGLDNGRRLRAVQADHEQHCIHRRREGDGFAVGQQRRSVYHHHVVGVTVGVQGAHQLRRIEFRRQVRAAAADADVR